MLKRISAGSLGGICGRMRVGHVFVFSLNAPIQTAMVTQSTNRAATATLTSQNCLSYRPRVINPAKLIYEFQHN